MVSLKDIAIKCGVSVATVSKSLNGHSDVSADTKRRVIDTARAMGYVPNAAAKSLKTEHTHSIGVLFVDEAQSGLTHDFFAHILDGFKRGIEEHGYDLTFISNNKDYPGRTTYLEHARYRRFDGVCIACVDFSNSEVLELVSSEIPIVTIDHIFNNCISVISDNVGGMQELVSYIFDRGHKKVSYIHGKTEATSSVTASRLAAFYRVAEQYGIEIPEEYIREAPYRDTYGSYEETLKLLDLDDPPTCILYPDDHAALGGIRAIKERGLTIPDDISVAGYDGQDLTRQITPMLTSVSQDTYQIGWIAAERLVNRIENPKTSLAQQYMVTANLFEGESVADLRSYENDE